MPASRRERSPLTKQWQNFEKPICTQAADKAETVAQESDHKYCELNPSRPFLNYSLLNSIK